MSTDTLTDWAAAYPYAALGVAALALVLAAGAVWLTARAVRSAVKPTSSVVVAAMAAAACTAYSADTSWRFAAHQLGMDSELERAAMFGAAELALFACALMARTSLRDSGAPGTPGLLVWVITGVQIIPAFVESGFWGGLVRAFVGPILAALLWHLAMGIEVRHAKPGALSSGLLAMLGRELRERMLSRLGLATRDRTAEQITRDRATDRAVRLAARPKLGRRGQARLAAAVARASVGTDPNQRQQLLLLLAARRGADKLRTVELASPWEPEQPPAKPATLPGLVHQQLTRMDPVDAVRTVRDAHPDATPAQLASLCTERGVVVSETQVRIAIGEHRAPGVARNATVQRPVATLPQRPATPATAATPRPCNGLVLDLAPMPAPQPEVRAAAPVAALAHTRTAVHVAIPDDGATPATPPDHGGLLTSSEVAARLGVQQTTVRTWKKRGRLKPRVTARGGSVDLFHPDDIANL